MNPIPNIEQRASIIKRIVISSLIAEYALLELSGTFDLKRRSNVAIARCRDVQNYLLANPNAQKEQREAFKREFLKDNAVLMGELVELCWDLNPDDLQYIIDQIRGNTDEPVQHPAL
jgi:hypothetical protein